MNEYDDLILRAKKELNDWKFGIEERLSREAWEKWNKLSPSQKKIIPEPKITKIQQPNPPNWFSNEVAPAIHLYKEQEIIRRLNSLGFPFDFSNLDVDSLLRFVLRKRTDEEKRLYFERHQKEAPEWKRISQVEFIDHFENIINQMRIEGKFTLEQQNKINIKQIKKDEFVNLIFDLTSMRRAAFNELRDFDKKYTTIDENGKEWYYKSSRWFDKKINIGTDDPINIFIEEPTLDLAIWSIIVKDALAVHQGYIYPRGLHYYLKGKKQKIPKLKKGRGKWENKQDWKVYSENEDENPYLNRQLNHLRYYGFIPQESVGDRRTKEGIVFEDHSYYKKATKPELEIKIGMKYGEFTQLQIPKIVLFTEKGHMQPLLEQISNDYIMGYFAAIGQISIRTAYDFYQDIKENGGQAIIFTLNDFDEGGISITRTFARKIQRHALEDRDLPPDKRVHIMIIPLLFQQQDIDSFEKVGVEKDYYVNKKKKKVWRYYIDQIYEYSAKSGISPKDYILKRIKDYLNEDLIIPRQQLKEEDYLRKNAYILSLQESVGISNLNEYFSSLINEIKEKDGIIKIQQFLDEESYENYIKNTIKDFRYENQIEKEIKELMAKSEEEKKELRQTTTNEDKLNELLKKTDLIYDNEILKLEDKYKLEEKLIKNEEDTILYTEAPYMENLGLLNRQANLRKSSITYPTKEDIEEFTQEIVHENIEDFLQKEFNKT